MNYLKYLFSACFILMLCLFNTQTSAFAADKTSGINPSYINTSEKNIKIGENIDLKIQIPTSWTMKQDQDGNYNFKYIYSENPLTITVFNMTQPYKNDAELKTFISMHEKAVLKTLGNPDKVKTGIDNVFKIPIPWMLVATPKDDGIIFHKLMYPYDGKKAFVVMITYNESSPIKESENMLSVLLLSIFKQA